MIMTQLIVFYITKKYEANNYLYPCILMITNILYKFELSI